MTKRLYVIGGPTAVGKTAFAIQLAQSLKTEIINADSRQFYKEMSIGTAKPSEEELAQVKHHFVGHLSVQDSYTAADFEKEALVRIEELFQQYDHLVLCGGSGLFIEAVLHGFDKLPEANQELRNTLNEKLEKQGIEALVAELKSLTSSLPESLDLQNPRRVIRAIEIAQLGIPEKTVKKERSFVSELFYLNMDREKLYKRINKRVDLMMENGLLDEVKSLYPYKSLNALQTVGYKELFSYLDNQMSLEEAVDKIKQHTRNYAKRQLTWFRNKDSYTELSADDKPLERLLNF